MKLRPRYKIEIDKINSSEAKKLLKESISNEKISFEIQANEFYFHIYMPEDERKVWTPYMEVTFEEVEYGTIIRASIGPAARIWLPFNFLYSFLTLSIIFATIYGFIQLNLGYQATMFYSLIPLFITMAGLYLMSYLGQKKSSHCIIVFDRILSLAFKNHPQRTLFKENS